MIYVIEAIGSGCVKIGYTRSNAEERRANLQSGCPLKLVIRYTFEGGRHAESRMHLEFNDFNVHGEWFMVDPSAVKEAYVRLENELDEFPHYPEADSVPVFSPSCKKTLLSIDRRRLKRRLRTKDSGRILPVDLLPDYPFGLDDLIDGEIIKQLDHEIYVEIREIENSVAKFLFGKISTRNNRAVLGRIYRLAITGKIEVHGGNPTKKNFHTQRKGDFVKFRRKKIRNFKNSEILEIK